MIANCIFICYVYVNCRVVWVNYYRQQIYIYFTINAQMSHFLHIPHYFILGVVNSRQTNFFIFDRTRSVSMDMHESCDFKPKKRNLNSPKNAYFRNFRLFCNFSPISTYFRINYDFSPVSFSYLFAERIFE